MIALYCYFSRRLCNEIKSIAFGKIIVVSIYITAVSPTREHNFTLGHIIILVVTR